MFLVELNKFVSVWEPVGASIDGKATIRVYVAKNAQFFGSKKRSFFVIKGKLSIYYSKFVLDP